MPGLEAEHGRRSGPRGRRRITEVTSAEFDALFTSFEHTAYRLETLQAYDVSYEEEPCRAFLAGHPQPRDPAKNQ